MFSKKLLLVAAMLAVVSGKPQGAEANEAELFGTVIGAATGGFIGSNIGSGNGQLAATAAGTLFGAMIGHNVTQVGYYRPQRSYHRSWNVAPDPVYVAPKRHRKYVTHNHRVIVKHVYPERHYSRSQSRKWKKRRNYWHRYENRQQRREDRCFYRPSRCGWFN